MALLDIEKKSALLVLAVIFATTGNLYGEMDDDDSFFPADPFAIPVVRSITIAPTVKTADFNLDRETEYTFGVLVQGALVEHFNQSRVFAAQASIQNIEEWDSESILAYFEEGNSELVAQAFIDQGRISVIMADVNNPSQFYMGDQPLTLPPGNLNMSADVLGFHLRSAFEKLIQKYAKGEMQWLPGSSPNKELEKFENRETLEKNAKITRKLFRELATVAEKPFYIGGNIGMARFAANKNAASTVNFGLHSGYNTNKYVFEMGLDVFTYALAHLDGKYHLPIEDRYISFQVGLGIGYIIGNITSNRGFESSNFNGGQILGGPGIHFTIPLLGTRLRGDVRLLIGKGSILIGTYGIEYSL